MKIPSMLLLLLSLLSLLSQPSCSTTILVDGVSEWKDPGVYIGDSIIFNHKYHYNLYIFQNQRAFNLCNFTQATLLTKPNSTSYTWHPSRPGFFYFTFNNGSLKSCNQDSQKLSIKVSPAPPTPHRHNSLQRHHLQFQHQFQATLCHHLLRTSGHPVLVMKQPFPLLLHLVVVRQALQW
ncbi:hypothetical protein OIU78_012459 [Salix suchowensis]|nr:hypothetical protein OIU78_012459 [Salix suchowensis]